MYISINGHHPKVSKKLIRQALRFCAPLLMSSRMIKTLDITVHCSPDLWQEEDCEGLCEVTLDCTPNPKIFDIHVYNRVGKARFIKTLFHEMVHCKQFATGELKEYVRQPKKIRFHDSIHYEEDISYWDHPWEIEAYGREYGLWKRFQEYLKDNK